LTQAERELFSLPIKLGGLGIPIFEEKACIDYETSQKIIAPLATIMILQGSNLPDETDIVKIKSEIAKMQTENLKNKSERIEKNLPTDTTRTIQQAKEKGASNWLSAIPLEEQGFTFTKGEFRDALALRYNKQLRGLPSKCPCGQKYDVNHGLNCKKGGFVIIRHNNIRDFEANLLSKVVVDVEMEPMLQPVNGEHLKGLKGDEARPDIIARGVYKH
jgi:hypothetical protein